jgi:hypothetical protein
MAISEADCFENKCIVLEIKAKRWQRFALIAACLLLIVIYPAWRGIFNNQTVDPYSGGGVNVLYFHEVTRSESEIPEVVITPNQKYLPVMIDEDLEDLFEITSSDIVNIKLQSTEKSEVLWSWHGAVNEITDEQNGVVSLLVKLPDNTIELDTLQIVFDAEKSDKQPVLLQFLTTQ